MKTSLLSGALVLALAAVAFAPMALAEEPAAVPAADEVPAVEATPQVEEAFCPAPEAIAPASPIPVSWGCPPGIPYCKVDDDCDAWCGHPAFGACEAPGCCSCYG